MANKKEIPQQLPNGDLQKLLEEKSAALELMQREAAIEAALEKVRSTSLAMHHSDELEKVVASLFDRFVELGLTLDGACIFLFEKEKRNIRLWIATKHLSTPAFIDLPYDKEIQNNTIIKDLWNAIESGKHLFNKSYSGKTKNDYFRYVAKHNELKIPESIRQIQIESESWTAYLIAEKNSIIGFDSWSGPITVSDEYFQVVIRFARVFEQAYVRFLDLQKAEAQAREAQIELGLERVRARAMAMQKSDELSELVDIVFKELTKLDFALTWCIINIIDVSSLTNTVWAANPDIDKEPESYYMKFEDYPYHHAILKDWKERKTKSVYTLEGNEKRIYDDYLFSETEFKRTPEVAQAASRAMEKYVCSFSFSNFGGLQTVGDAPLSEANLDILSRFGKVFDLTYTRFNDLKQAEAQAREAKIETALEKVRSRTMAMQKSEELTEVAGLLFKQVTDLGIKSWTAGFNVWSDDNNSYVDYITSPNGGFIEPYTVLTDRAEALQDISNARKSGVEFDVQYVEGEKIKQLYIALTGLGEEQFEKMRQDGNQFPSHQYEHFVFGSKLSLMFITYEPVPEAHDIFKRFGKVFEQTYTRFLDLQNAEAQARESQIQLAMERVRARTMAMQHSDELLDVASILFQQVKALGVPQWNCGFNIWETGDKEFTYYPGTPDGIISQSPCKIPLTEHPVFISFDESRRRGDELFVYEKEGDYQKGHYQYMLSLPGVGDLLQSMLDVGFEFPVFQIDHVANFAYGNLIFITYKHFPEMHDVFKRFAKVFEQTYIRFLDLQKAEAQAKEARIESALEKVRSRTMAMQRSEELPEVAVLLFQQVKTLGVPQFHCGFNIFEIDDKECTWYPGSTEGDILPPCKIPLTEHPVFIAFNESRKRGDELFVYEKEGEYQAGHYRYMLSLPVLGEILQNMLDAGIPFPTFQIDHLANFSHGNLLFITSEHFPEMHDTFKRFAKVFEQTYTRFLDLQKAEAQAREAQIEAALERVRSRSMAMHKSEELVEVVRILDKEIIGLRVEVSGTQIVTDFANPEDGVNDWYAREGQDDLEKFHIPYLEHPITNRLINALNKNVDFYTENYSKAEKNKYFRLLFKYSDFAKFSKERQEFVYHSPAYIRAVVASKNSILIFQRFDLKEFTKEEEGIFKRFGKVFEQAYTRFLDLQKAEAQAREAQIQLALERVRARTMAMQKSEELNDVATILFNQLRNLGGSLWTCAIVLCRENSAADEFRTAFENGMQPSVFIPNNEDDVHIKMYEGWKNKAELFSIAKGGDELREHYNYMVTVPSIQPVLENMLASGIQFPLWQKWHAAYFTSGYLLIITTGDYPEAEIFIRFAKVFEQSYTRFLDLQKAETQAREAQIEASLERVRSRTMGMQHSDHLKNVIEVIGHQLQALGLHFDFVNFIVGDTTEGFDTWNVSFGQADPVRFFIPYLDNRLFHEMVRERAEKLEFNSFTMTANETHQFIKHLITNTILKYLPEEQLQKRLQSKGMSVSTAVLNEVYLTMANYSAIPYTDDGNSILRRFGFAFQQAFTRFLDLQKAEAQARESQIELALERVRARTMAMQHSDELQDAAILLFQQMKALGVQTGSCGFNIWNKDEKAATVWMSSPEGGLQTPFILPHTESSIYKEVYGKMKKGETFLVKEVGGKDLKKHFDYLLTLPGIGDVIKKLRDAGYSFPEWMVYHFAFFSQGYLSFHLHEHHPETHNIFKRFAKVFEQTYTRFLDLQKAEAQALETVKRASVDRVRAEIASMRTTNDLERITPLIWRELRTIGVPFIRCGVFLMDEEQQQVHTFLSTPDGAAIAAFHQPFNTPGETATITAHWQKKKMYKQHWDEAQFIEFTKNLVEQGAITSGGKYLVENRPTNLDLHFLPFMQGMLYVGNTAPLSDDELQLVQNLADAFSTAYARYEDFNKLESAKEQIEKTLVDLKQAQAQLVQSAKMASLGELTAGIAHEIQNPLNFVNNFSEVNQELLVEMKDEMDKGNMEDAKAIANDVIDNEEKINHHGKRADAIVKGMLQHSRSSTATKEATNINALADEYLRLAYHGLRAKDKSFNATLKTDFDETIQKIDIIPQDIGRVILNLINNAFYATGEKQKAESLKPAHNKYEPLVSIETKKVNNHIEIKVSDNGNGIPKKISDKIFQPFFTTKPTGQGTGLGLSLAYDIVKAHGGEIRVKTREGEGTEFTIQLPII